MSNWKKLILVRIAKTSLALLVLASTFSYIATALPAEGDSDLRTSLKRLMEGKTFSLKTPYSADHLQFDQDGSLLGESEIGAWPMYGLLAVNDVDVKGDSIVISGFRVSTLINPRTNALYRVESNKPVEITLNISNHSAETGAQEVLKKVFWAGSIQERFDRYWKPLVPNGSDLLQSRVLDRPVALLEENREVYNVGGSVKPPQAMDSRKSPDERRTSGKVEKRHLRLLLVLNEKGQPELAELLQAGQSDPISGLLSGIAQWHFEPALKNGKPVAAILMIELDLRLTPD